MFSNNWFPQLAWGILFNSKFRLKIATILSNDSSEGTVHLPHLPLHNVAECHSLFRIICPISPSIEGFFSPFSFFFIAGVKAFY